MSQYVHLNVIEGCGVAFDSVDAMNAELKAANHGTLAELLLDANGRSIETGFVRFEDGHVSFFDRERQSHSQDAVNTWSCFSEPHLDVVARHMTAGRLVLAVETEGWGTKSYILTPSLVEQPSR
jgi:hypothetical protein